MSDHDDLNLDGEDVNDSGAPQKKKRGILGGLLPNILKFAAIGLGALIFIVTVVVITVNIINKRGTQQTTVSSPESPYLGTRQIFAIYDQIGSITTRTRDPMPGSNVTVVMNIGYDQDNQEATLELINRRHELRDFVRRYFATKYASDLVPEKEDDLKREIREQLNTRFLDKARVRIILFDRLDVMENF